MAPRAKATKTQEKLSVWPRIIRHAHAQIRFLIALAVGVLVALLLPSENLVPRILAGWNAGGWLYLVLVGIKMAHAEIEGIKREAGIERESRIAVLVVVIFGSIVTMLALFAQLMAIKSEHGIEPQPQYRPVRLDHPPVMATDPYGIRAFLRARISQ